MSSRRSGGSPPFFEREREREREKRERKIKAKERTTRKEIITHSRARARARASLLSPVRCFFFSSDGSCARVRLQALFCSGLVTHSVVFAFLSPPEARFFV